VIAQQLGSTGTAHYDAELRRIDAEIADAADGALDPPLDTERTTRFVHALFQRASLTGDLGELAVVERAIGVTLPLLPNPTDFYYLRACVGLKLHRLDAVRADLAASEPLRRSVQGRTLQADVDLQAGRYDDARCGYAAVIRDDPTWDAFARLAHVEAKLGDPDAARQLYADAEDELTAKQMRQYGWLELQLGLLDLAAGDHAGARAHYERSAKAYTGHWMCEEHLAELSAAEGDLGGAIAAYERVVERAPRPEFQQALGELHLFSGDAQRAEPWLDRALAAYLGAARNGGVHYYHHLADFYADVREDGAEAVRWAEQDHALRENFATQAAFAWALYRNRRFSEAGALMDRALASGVRDARIFAKAGAIHDALGDSDGAARYAARANELNPHHTAFHVHR
jgi:tetratricopeptide (TPR) repeat protein